MDDRKQYIGASDIAAILGISPYKTAYQLWEEKTGRREPEDLSGQFHIERGHAVEVDQRMKLEVELGVNFEIGHKWQSDAYPFMICHDDGYNEVMDCILEIKYMGAGLVAGEQIPDYYMAQIQYELYVSRVMKCIFRAQDSKGNTFTETIHPFKEWQDKVYEAAINFWNNHILTDTPPELTDQDTVDMGGNEELALLLSEYESTDAQIKDLEEYKADCRGKIDELCTSTRAKCAGYLMYRSSRAGNIDYKKIPELKGMDLEKYRSKPSSVFTIKKVKEE